MTTQTTLTLAQERIVELRLAGLSTRQIASALNQEQVGGRPWGRWHHPSVARELPLLGLHPALRATCQISWTGPLPRHGDLVTGMHLGVPRTGRVAALIPSPSGTQVWIQLPLTTPTT